MWIARPVYELIPYLYIAVGLVLLGAAWLLNVDMLPGIFLLLGSLSLLAGIVLWLRRKDYRTTQAEYNSKSLDETLK
ncbi:MAG: hypothetical protein ACJ8OJ_14300 [Povalibacter sp.]